MAGTIVQSQLVDGILTADAAGRLKMADSFVNAAKIEGDAVTELKLADNAVAGSKIHSSLIRIATGTLSSAQLLALMGTPITVIGPPPDPQDVIRFHGGLLFYDYGGTAYTVTAAGDDLGLRYTDGAGAKVAVDVDTAGLIDQAADRVKRIEPATGDLVGVVGAAIVFDNIGANEWTLGNGVLRYALSYSIHPSGF